MNLVISSLRSQYHFLLGNAAIREVIFYPQLAGIGQCDPSPPQLFSFCAAIIIYPVRQLRVKMGMHLYVDCFLITFGQETTKQQLNKVFHELQRFSAVSGPQQKVGKSAYVTKGTPQPEALQCMQDSGLQHETKVRYLGVPMGHVSVKEAFVGPLREAYGRARIAVIIALSIPEKITLPKTWILPTLLLTARAYVAHRSVVSALNTVYNILFCFHSWGITTHPLSQHRDQGGYSVRLPQKWLAAPGGRAAVAALTSPANVPVYVMQAFVKFCTRYGIPTNHKVFAVTQMGPVSMKGAGQLAHNYEAYSLPRKGIKVKHSLPLKDLPPWHSTIFVNKYHNTYFAPHLIRQGVLTVVQLIHSNLVMHSHMHHYISRSWLPIYQQALQQYQALPINDWSPPAYGPAARRSLPVWHTWRLQRRYITVRSPNVGRLSGLQIYPPASKILHINACGTNSKYGTASTHGYKPMPAPCVERGKLCSMPCTNVHSTRARTDSWWSASGKGG